MSLFSSILDGVTGIGNLVLGGIGLKQSHDQHKENIQFQEDKLEYDKDLQNTIFSREDNAVQRRVADLKAAGINPIFAAGSSANAGSVVSTTAPHGDVANKLHANQLVMNALKMASEIAHTRADTRRINKQTELEDKRYELEERSVRNLNDRLELDRNRLSLDRDTYRLKLVEEARHSSELDLRKQQHLLERQRHSVEQIIRRYQIENLTADIAIKELQKIGLSANNASLLIDNDIKVYDLIQSIRMFIRYKDTPDRARQLGNLLGGSSSIGEDLLEKYEGR